MRRHSRLRPSPHVGADEAYPLNVPRKSRTDDHDPGVTVLVADRQALFVRRLVTALNAETGIRVVGQSDDGDGAVRRAAALRPDVALVGADLRTEEGQAAAAVIQVACSGTRVVLIVDRPPLENEVSRADLDQVVGAVLALAAEQ